MHIPDGLKDYGPYALMIVLVGMFLRDRRTTTDRLYDIMDEIRSTLVEVRELIKAHARSSRN